MHDDDNQNSCKSKTRSAVQANAGAQPDACYDRPMAEPNNNDLIDFIATTVETMRDQMATKDDLARMATRIETMRDQMATKDDLVRMATRIETMRDQMATKDDLVTFATKDDLARMATKIDVAAIRGDLEQVQVRLDSIDRAIGARLGSG